MIKPRIGLFVYLGEKLIKMIRFWQLAFISVILFTISCTPDPINVTTVTGGINAKKMGKTLSHEHLLVDFIGADSISYNRWDREEVAKKVLPYLEQIKNLGYKTFVDATPAYLGRDPELLKMLSEKSGIQILTNTGYYSANEKFVPEFAFTESAQELAARWIDEVNNGIEGTDIYPGFIKIAVNSGPLTELNKKIVEAACITHRETGLTIMSHTGPALPAFQELEILKENGIQPSAFIWTHAQNENDNNKLLEAAKMGAYVSFDNFKAADTTRYVDFILFMKKHGVLHKVLLSHDAGWYQPGEPDDGNFRGYTDLDTYLVPALEKEGIAQFDLFMLFFDNPANAFMIRKRLIQE